MLALVALCLIADPVPVPEAPSTQACMDGMRLMFAGLFERGRCAGLPRQQVIRDEVEAYIAGRPSLLSLWFDYLDREGKLDAVLERARNSVKFRPTDGYGGVPWGASLKEAQKLLPKAKGRDGGLVMTGTIAGLPASTTFVFTAGKLTDANVTFEATHGPTNAEGYVRDFRFVDDLLTQKYGEGINIDGASEGANALDELAQDLAGAGRAVRAGRLTVAIPRHTPVTGVLHLLRGDGGNIYHEIMYSSVQLAELRQASDRARLLGDL